MEKKKALLRPLLSSSLENSKNAKEVWCISCSNN